MKQLSESLLDKDADVKKVWETDAFFHTSEGWEEQDNNVRLMTLLGVKKRIDYLYSVIA